MQLCQLSDDRLENLIKNALRRVSVDLLYDADDEDVILKNDADRTGMMQQLPGRHTHYHLPPGCGRESRHKFLTFPVVLSRYCSFNCSLNEAKGSDNAGS